MIYILFFYLVLATFIIIDSIYDWFFREEKTDKEFLLKFGLKWFITTILAMVSLSAIFFSDGNYRDLGMVVAVIMVVGFIWLIKQMTEVLIEKKRESLWISLTEPILVLFITFNFSNFF